MEIVTKVKRDKTIQIRVSDEELEMYKKLMSLNWDVPHMVRDFMSELYKEIPNE